MRLLLLAAVLCGCAPDDDDRPPSAPEPPQLPRTGGCGAVAWDWIEPASLGQVVEWSYAPEYDLPAGAVALILGSLGLEDLRPTYDVRTYLVRYTTQDRGAEVEATMWLTVPDTDEEVDLVVWGHGTTGFSDACAPTALGVEGVGLPAILSSLGVAVAAPDYLGMNGFGAPSTQRHPYVVPEPTAVAVLDSVRAAWSFVDTGTDASLAASLSRRLGLIGASQGGNAVLWADRYAGAYLPEAELLGTVASVPPVDMFGLARGAMSAIDDPTVALVAYAHTATDWYGVGDPADVLTDEAPAFLVSEGWANLTDDCSWSNVLAGTDTVDQIFTPAALAAVQQDDPDFAPWDCFLEESSLSSSPVARSSTAPVLIVTGEDDTMVVPEVVAADLSALCADGYAIDHVECAGAGHVPAAIDSLALQWEWLSDRLLGVDGAGDCVVREPVVCDG